MTTMTGQGATEPASAPDENAEFPPDPEAAAAVRAAAEAAHRAKDSLARAPEDAISGALRAMAGSAGPRARWARRIPTTCGPRRRPG